MGNTVWANQEALEGTVTTEIVLTLSRKSRAIEIVNDSGTRDLQFKFNATESYASLKPLEAFSADFTTRTVYLQSENTGTVPYRIRSLS